MLIYYAVLLLCFISIFVKDGRLRRILLVSIALFLCCGYMCGTDWRNYENSYNDARLFSVENQPYELGYNYLQTFFHSFGVDFWVFHITLKFLVFYSICRCVHLLSANLFLFWFIFLPEMGFYLFIDCPFRNLIAVGGFCFMIKTLLDRKLVSFLILVYMLSLFHTSALFLLVIYPILNLKINNFVYYVLFIFSNILAYKIDLITDHILFPLLSIDGYWGEKVRAYFFNDDFWSTAINIGTVFRILTFFIIVHNREKIESTSKYGRYIFNLSMLFFLVYPFGISMKMIQRFLFYLMPFYVISLESVISQITKKMQAKCQIVLVVISLWGIIKVYSITTYDYRYVPYTNYCGYLFEDLPYTYRDDYNIKKSPYGEN